MMSWADKIDTIKAAYRTRYGIELSAYKLARILTATCGRTIQHKTVLAIANGSIPKEDVARAIDDLAGKNTITTQPLAENPA